MAMLLLYADLTLPPCRSLAASPNDIAEPLHANINLGTKVQYGVWPGHTRSSAPFSPRPPTMAESTSTAKHPPNSPTPRPPGRWYSHLPFTLRR